MECKICNEFITDLAYSSCCLCKEYIHIRCLLSSSNEKQCNKCHHIRIVDIDISYCNNKYCYCHTELMHCYIVNGDNMNIII